MEQNVRYALIIISTIIIGAIFFHCLWTIRKNKNPYKLKAKPESFVDEEQQYDSSGFDQLGVSQPKVVKKNNLQPNDGVNEAESELLHDEPSIGDINNVTLDIEEKAETNSNETFDFGNNGSNTKAVNTQVNATSSENINQPNQNSEIHVEQSKISSEPNQETIEHGLKPEQKTLYQDPVIQAKPESKIKSFKARTQSAKDLKRNQLEIDFDNQQSKSKEQPKEEIEPEFIVISVVAPENETISGAELLPHLLTLGMRYGQMNIFHRHQDNAGNGEVTFSLANIVNPGTFDLNQMETFTTKGVSLFMSLPNKGNAFEVFDQMLSAAKHLAMEFNGQLLDDKRNVLTKQTEQHYLSKIREVERKHRINHH